MNGERPYFNWGIFRLRFDFPKGLLRAAERGSGPAMREVDQAVRNTAQEVADKLEQALSKHYKFRVGATERASQNFIITYSSGLGHAPQAEISEGTLTPANFFIRRGSTGHGKPPPIANIREWVMAKRDVLDFHYTDRRRKTKSIHFTKGGRAWSSQEDKLERIVHKLRWSIAYLGTSTASEARPPVGARYFDYLKWVASQKYLYERMLVRSEALARIFGNFMLAGGKVDLESFGDARGFRFRTYD